MNLSLLRFFKKEKAAPSTPATTLAPPPPLEKPASERFGKTVMPNAARVMEPSSGALAPAGPKPFSLGSNRSLVAGPGATPRPAPGAARTIALQLTELLPQIPAELLATAEIDPEQRIIFNASELERGMATGRPAVLLRSIYQQAPAIFTSEVDVADAREITLPFHKVLEQFASLQVRVDQEVDDAVPQVETPFLQVTMEDGKKFGTQLPAARAATLPLPVIAPVVVAESVAPVVATPMAAPKPNSLSKIPSRAPIRLSLPTEMGAPVGSAVATPVQPPPPATLPLAPKITPNGAGAPITERVPASLGSSAPTPSPMPPAPATAPARIPFKVTPPASDLCPPPALPLRSAAASRTPVVFSDKGPRVRLSLRAVLRGIPPFQCTGPIDTVPEDAKIELPFSIVETQLSLGRVAISPAQFQAAMPEQYRSLFKMDEGGIPVSLPLSEILENLPNESLQLRLDQEEVEVAQLFETPFSQKAAEDAARMKIPSGPIAKPTNIEAAVTAAPSAPVRTSEISLPLPTRPPLHATAAAVSAETSATAPARRNALQIALDTDDLLDAKSAVTHACRLPGVSACAIVFSDGLSLAGNIPDVYEADALCAMAPEIVKRIEEQMNNANLGALRGITVFCAKAPVSFFAHGNICLAALHSAGEIAAEIRDRLGRTTQELARMYARSA